MEAFDIEVSKNSVPELCRVAMMLMGPLQVHQRMVKAGVNLTKDHLRDVGSARDHGSRFYGSYVNVVHGEATEDSGEVRIPPVFNKEGGKQRGNPLASHYFGYTFTQANLTNSKYYTIPATNEARYKSAREFGDNLRFVPLKGPKAEGALVLRSGGAKKLEKKFTGKDVAGLKRTEKKEAKKGRLPVMFWLIRGFQLTADTTVLPTEEQYLDAGVQAVVDAIEDYNAGFGAAGGAS